MVPAILLYLLAALGIVGTIGLITIAIIVLYRYNGTPAWSFRWYWRNWRLMQLSAIGSLFFLAMAASYGLLHETWGILYLLVALKTGTWWLHCVINRRA